MTEFSKKEFFEKIVGRPEIELLNNSTIQENFENKKILITGAGGTIGSAVAKRLAEAQIKSVYYLDRDESALHALALNLSDTAASHSKNCLIVDIRDSDGLRTVFEEVQPDLVVHTAALKHLVVLERFPREGYLTNVLGTNNVLTAARAVNAKRVLNVSTDKAALPSSILGKTKLIAERITDEFSTNELLTSSVRFGNVFASRGSVIETFIHQIEQGLPITITHPEVTRFFMSQNEAANLILSTCLIQEAGVFVQEMGERIKILDIVNNLVSYLEAEVQVKFIGLQNGEKLHEDLYEKEFTTTENPAIVKIPNGPSMGIMKIMKDMDEPINHEEALNKINRLMDSINLNGQ
jgi:FlaA1/EpsC-like NDP-sugar epimerase